MGGARGEGGGRGAWWDGRRGLTRPAAKFYTWFELETTAQVKVLPPSGRSGSSCFTLSSDDPRIFIHGGASETDTFKDMYILNTHTNKWTKAHTFNAPRQRTYHTTLMVGPNPKKEGKAAIPRLLCYGGIWKGTLDIDVWLLEEWGVMKDGTRGANKLMPQPKKELGKAPKGRKEDVWEKRPCAGHVPIARSNHTATSIAGKYLIVFGGWHGAFVNDLYVLDINSWTWALRECTLSTVAQFGGMIAPRAGHTATLVKGRKIVVFGGQNQSGQLSDVWVLDTIKWEWDRPMIAGTPPVGRSGHTAAYSVAEDKIFFFGGWDGRSVHEGLTVLSIKGDMATDWYWETSRTIGTKVPGRIGHCSIIKGTRMYIFGGFREGKFLNNVAYLDMNLARSRMRGAIKKARPLMFGIIRRAKEKAEEPIHRRIHAGENLNAVNEAIDLRLKESIVKVQRRATQAEADVAVKERQIERAENIAQAQKRSQLIQSQIATGKTMREALEIADTHTPLKAHSRKSMQQLQKALEDEEVPSVPAVTAQYALKDDERQALIVADGFDQRRIDELGPSDLLDLIAQKGGLADTYDAAAASPDTAPSTPERGPGATPSPAKRLGPNLQRIIKQQEDKQAQMRYKAPIPAPKERPTRPKRGPSAAFGAAGNHRGSLMQIEALSKPAGAEPPSPDQRGLEALDAGNAPKFIVAQVTSVQSVIKGWLERKKYRRLRAVMRIQAHVRGWKARRQVRKIKVEKGLLPPEPAVASRRKSGMMSSFRRGKQMERGLNP